MEQNIIQARIIAVHKNRFECVKHDGSTCFATLKRTAYKDQPREMVPTVGDLVELCKNEMGDSQILKTLPRISLLKRTDPSSFGRYEQLLAANVNHVFILTSANEDFNVKRIRRYMLVAQQSGADFSVIINKADLLQDHALQSLKAQSDHVLGRQATLLISCKNSFGIDRLRSIMHPGSISVFLGSSGVGKSSLVNALMEEQIMDTGAIREDDAKGRHTTTGRQMLVMPNGAMIIDTPGMRELGLWDAQNVVSDAFDDVTDLIGRCRFRNCTHTYEAGCKIQEALQKGLLTSARYDEYRQLFAEARKRPITKKSERRPKPFDKNKHKLSIRWDDEEYD